MATFLRWRPRVWTLWDMVGGEPKTNFGCKLALVYNFANVGSGGLMWIPKVDIISRHPCKTFLVECTYHLSSWSWSNLSSSLDLFKVVVAFLSGVPWSFLVVSGLVGPRWNPTRAYTLAHGKADAHGWKTEVRTRQLRYWSLWIELDNTWFKILHATT